MKPRLLRLVPLLFVILSLSISALSAQFRSADHESSQQPLTERPEPSDKWGTVWQDETKATPAYEKAAVLLHTIQPATAPWWDFKKSGVLGTGAYYAKELFFLLFMNAPPQPELLTTNPQPKKLNEPLANAVQLLEEAADAQDPDAIFTLAEMNFYGNFSHPRNYTEAFRRYHDLATLSGNATAQHMVGFIYATGIGGAVKQDQAKAMLYHTLAAEGGDVRSEMTVAYRHASGISTPRNCDQALHYYKSVANKAIKFMRSGPPGGYSLLRESYRVADEEGGVYGDGASVTSSGRNARRGYSDAYSSLDNVVEYMDLQAKKGDLRAKYNLATLNYDGSRASARNLPEAKRRLLEIARMCWTKEGRTRQNVPKEVLKYASKSAGHLGRMFLRAEGVPENFAIAKTWFTRGVEHADALSQYSLGIMYLHGLGVPKNPVKAADLFKAAADQNSPIAQVRLGALFLDQGDVPTAIKYFEIAAHNGHLEAYYYLAELTNAGVGRDKSCMVASAHYKTVAEKAEAISTSFPEANDAYDNGDLETALVGYMMAAEQGFEVGQANVAFMLDQAKPHSTLSSLLPFMQRKAATLVSDAYLALLYWTRSAEQGNIDSMVKVGDYYLQGLGTEPDHEKAAACYTSAAETMVSAQALWNLGWMHENGIGIEQDFHLAKRHYDLSLETNPREAYLPVVLALYKLRLRSWWNKITNGNIKSIEEEPVIKKQWSLSEWITAFLAEIDGLDDATEPDDYDGHMAGLETDYLDDDLDSEILDSLVILGLTVALAFLIYYRGQRQRRAEEERERQEQVQLLRNLQGQVQQAGARQQQGGGGGGAPQNGDFLNWLRAPQGGD